MQCCACGAVAKDKTPTDFDGVVVECLHCGEYGISGSALNNVLRLSLPECADALAKARRFTKAASHAHAGTDVARRCRRRCRPRRPGPQVSGR